MFCFSKSDYVFESPYVGVRLSAWYASAFFGILFIEEGSIPAFVVIEYLGVRWVWPADVALLTCYVMKVSVKRDF